MSGTTNNLSTSELIRAINSSDEMIASEGRNGLVAKLYPDLVRMLQGTQYGESLESVLLSDLRHFLESNTQSIRIVSRHSLLALFRTRVKRRLFRRRRMQATKKRGGGIRHSSDVSSLVDKNDTSFLVDLADEIETARNDERISPFQLKILDAILDGFTITETATTLGVSRDVIRREIRKLQEMFSSNESNNEWD